tara:strand:- start:623 stop:889 length:267 start_codon:yes stop_codon:yes gene_type:complete
MSSERKRLSFDKWASSICNITDGYVDKSIQEQLIQKKDNLLGTLIYSAPEIKSWNEDKIKVQFFEYVVSLNIKEKGCKKLESFFARFT